MSPVSPVGPAVRWTAAGVYAVIGVVAAVAPERVPAVFGGTAGTPEARTEVRTVYAGIPLALATSLVTVPRRDPEGGRAAVDVVGAATAGMALARLAGCAVERRLAPWPTGFFLALEAALAGGLLAAARADRPRRVAGLRAA